MKKNNKKESKILDKYMDYSKSSKEFILDNYQEGTENSVLSE